MKKEAVNSQMLNGSRTAGGMRTHSTNLRGVRYTVCSMYHGEKELSDILESMIREEFLQSAKNL